MSLEKYIDKAQLEQYGKDRLEEIVRIFILPGVKVYIQETDNPWDDMAYNSLEDLLLEYVDKINGQVD